MCIACVENTLKNWKTKVIKTNEPLNFEETMQLMDLCLELIEDVENGSVEEDIIEDLGFKAYSDCLNSDG